MMRPYEKYKLVLNLNKSKQLNTIGNFLFVTHYVIVLITIGLQATSASLQTPYVQNNANKLTQSVTANTVTVALGFTATFFTIVTHTIQLNKIAENYWKAASNLEYYFTNKLPMPKAIYDSIDNKFVCV